MTRLPRRKAVRPAIARGIPVQFVDILLDHLGIDEKEITLDSRLGLDLGADELDICELALAFEEKFALEPFWDEILDTWPAATIATVLADLRKAGAKIEIAKTAVKAEADRPHRVFISGRRQ